MLSTGHLGSKAGGGRLPLLAIFFLSGASGLIYQVVWSRSLVLVFGSTTHAISTVLAAFMGGLAIGSALVGRRGDRLKNPLRTYAWIEVAIAALAVAVLFILPALVPIWRGLAAYAGPSETAQTMLRFLLAAGALLPPTILMGATLPILSSWIERRSLAGGNRVAGSGASALYAANTVGAVAGTALAGFVLLPSLGMTGTALAAAAANLAAAVAALLLAARTVAIPSDQESVPDEVATARTTRPATARLADPVWAGLLVAFAASGAGALIFEVVWTRILSLVLGSSTEAFTIMLTTFLAGLGLGSVVLTRLLPRVSNPLLVFALVEIGAGLTAFLGMSLFQELPWGFLLLFREVGGESAWFQAGRFALASLIMLPPTLLLGCCFPLAARAALMYRRGVADPVAVLYAANTFGAIIGSLVAGFRLIPQIGLAGSLVVGCTINLMAAVVLLAIHPSARPALRVSLAVALLLCIPGLILGRPEWSGPIMTSGVFQYAPRYLQQFHSRREFRDYHDDLRQLYYRDGPTTTVAVEKRPERVDGEINVVLSVNGKVDASSVGDMDTQMLLAHLPLMIADDPRSVMVIGMGSGVTVGSVLTHPIEKVAVVEIEPAILEASVHFEGVNRRPLADRRTAVRINDARNDLLLSDEMYDVIISEPSNPWISGPSKLFTREFFDLARRRLNDGGLLCQWVQLYGLDSDALKTLLRTFAAVFPHRMVFKGSLGDLLVLGSAQPILIDPAQLADRLAHPDVAADLSRVLVLEPADLLARFRLSSRGVLAYAGSDGPQNTDDNALIEFAAARTLYREDNMANDRDIAAQADVILPHLPVMPMKPGERTGATADLAAALARRLVRGGLVGRAQNLIDAALGLDGITPKQRAALLAAQGDRLLREGAAKSAEDSWREALAIDPSEERAASSLAARLTDAGNPSAAIDLLMVCGSALCRIEQGRAHLRAGDPQAALKALDLVELPSSCSGVEAGHDPETGPLLHLHRGRALVALKRYTEAIRDLRFYFDRFPAFPRPAEVSVAAVADLAQAWLALGETAKALAEFRVGAGLADSLSSWNRRQGEHEISIRNLAAAERNLREALRWNSGDQAARRLLAYILNETNQLENAVTVWRELDTALSGDKEALRNIAGISLRLKRPADAIAAFRSLRIIEPDPAIIAQLDLEIEAIAKTGPP